ncbi:hypothetical protein HanRHA438_Chr07g0321971 [Helianthus annuus]|nr:hypothetical protein HanRHA438_Chr07g0321971 [Helianthus annuus]
MFLKSTRAAIVKIFKKKKEKNRKYSISLGVQTARELLEIGSRKSSKRAEPYRARAKLEPQSKARLFIKPELEPRM